MAYTLSNISVTRCHGWWRPPVRQAARSGSTVRQAARSGRQHEYLADHAGLCRLVRRDDVVEREAMGWQLGERPSGERGGNVGDRLVDGGPGDRVQQHEPQHHVRGYAGTYRQRGIALLGGVRDDDRVRPGHGQVELQVGTESHLDHPVDVLTDRLDLAGGVGLGVDDNMTGTRLPGQFRLGRAADGRDDLPGPGPGGELDGEVPDRPRTTCDAP